LVSDAGLIAISGMQNLEALGLRGTSINGAGLYRIPAQKLLSLHLTDTKFASSDLHHLPPFPKLQTLKLDSLEIDDASLQVLGYYPNLKHVELDQTGITGQGLEYLMSENRQLTRLGAWVAERGS
jgi:hypothetical protein